MSHELLIQDLRLKGEENIRAIWQDAEAEVEQYKADASNDIEQKKLHNQHEQNLAYEALSKSYLLEAENKARKIRTETEDKLAERLYALARTALDQFRMHDYEELFITLAKEIPSREWESVRVNPADESLARQLFSQSQLIGDESISGGLEVIGSQSNIRIVNTLEKRLERAWPTILPEVYAQIFKEIQAYESAR